MAYFLYGLFFTSCVIMVVSVLLQPGKTDAGALFTSNISSSDYKPRGSQSILAKITIVAATTFILSALMLSLPALTGNVSVLQTTGNIEGPAKDVVTTEGNVNTAAPVANANIAAPAANSNVGANTPANAETQPSANTSSNK